MRKTVLLLLMMLLCSTAAWAATEYGIYVAGTKVTSDNCNNIVNNYITGGKVVYTHSTKTLTLTNVTINTGTTSNNGINNYDCDGLTVRFVGTCNISLNNKKQSVINVEEKTYVTIASGTTTFTQSASDGNCVWVDTHESAQLYIYGPGKLVMNAPDGFGIECKTTDNDGVWSVAYPSAPVYYQNGCDLTINTGRNGLRRGYHLFYDCNVTIKATNNSGYPNVAVQNMFYYNGAVITTPDGAALDYSGSSQFNNVKVNGNTVYTQDIVITNQYYLLLNSTNFPDANFRAYMRSLYPKGYMTQAEVNSLTTLNAYSRGIANMKGIEKLTALKKLYCYSNTFTSLDLSSNTALTYLDCAPNSNLTSLNVASCTNLETLACYNTGITSLNVSNLSKLKNLQCNNTKLTSLNVTGKSNLYALNCSNCTSLTNLYCYNNALTTLNVTGNTALKDLRCYENANLAAITGLADCTAITYLDCEDCKISDLSACNSMGNLQMLYARNNKLTTFTLNYKSNLTYVRLNGNTSLTTATIYGNSKLATLYITGCTALATLNCYVNALTSLNVSSNTALKNLQCYSNANLATITGLANCTAITYLDCAYCAITDLSAVNSMTNLEKLYASNNKLTTFTLTNKSNLTHVALNDNTSLTTASLTNNSKLATLYITGCTELEYLFCYGNALTSLNLTGSTAITYLDCSKNKLTALNVSPLTELVTLMCYQNPSLSSITGLANSASTLTDIYTNDCNLASLDVSSLSSLRILACFNNRITSLNVQGKRTLTTLHCYGNQLTSLYVQGCTALQNLYCHNNKFTDAGMTTLVNSLPTRTTSNPGKLYVLNNTGENNVFTSAHAAAAAAKNWNPYRYNGSSWVVISAIKIGDVNGDGDVDIADVTMLINYVLTGAETDMSIADVNGDGDLDIADVTMLINNVLTGTR